MREQLEKFQDSRTDEYPYADPECGVLAGPDQEEDKTPEKFVEYPPSVIVEPDESRSPVEFAEKSQGSDDCEAEKGLVPRVEPDIFHYAFFG